MKKEEDLNNLEDYYDCKIESVLTVKYRGLRLIASKAARNELRHYRLGLEDCKKILENGYEPKKRKKNTIEKWFDKGNKTYNVVIVKSYNYFYNEELYLITHIGEFTKW